MISFLEVFKLVNADISSRRKGAEKTLIFFPSDLPASKWRESSVGYGDTSAARDFVFQHSSARECWLP